MSKFHEETFKLLPKRPRRSAKNAALLKEREEVLGIRFPASVREWYELEGSVALLRKNSNDDRPVELKDLGAPEEDWYGGGRRDFVSQSLLWFMIENQGVCNWLLKLDGSDDPEVLVEVDTAPNDKLMSTSARFSEFVWCQVWDHLPARASCGAQEAELLSSDLEMLRSKFAVRRTTTGWPGDVQHRFESDAGRILIWDGEASLDWHLCASTPAGLRTLLDDVWRCGKLAKTLYGYDKLGEKLLAERRGR